MTVREALSVAPWGYVCAAPLSNSGADSIVLAKPGIFHDGEEAMRKSFGKLLEKREKAHEKAMKKPDKRVSQFYEMHKYPANVTLNRNIESFDDLLGMQVKRITSRGAQGGASWVIIQVADIYEIDPYHVDKKEN